MRLPRTFAAKAGVVFLTGAVVFAASEFALRQWFHAVPQLDLDLYERDAQGNLRLRPGVERRHVSRLWDVLIHINSEGWRDREPEPGAELPNVLGLGDSMAFGWGVEQQQSFLSLLEERLDRERPMRLVKAAVPGTGTSDQARLLETLWPAYDPRAVILCFFVGNDFVDVQMGGAAQFDVENGLLSRRPLGNQPVSWWQTGSGLARRSHLLQLMRAVQLNWSRADSPSPAAQDLPPRRWDEWLREFAQIHRKKFPERTARAAEQTLRHLDEILELCRSRAVPFLLLIIPRSYQVYPEEQAELLAALEVSEADLDLDRPQRLLAEWASARGVPAVDLLPAFRVYTGKNPGTQLYFRPDAHLNSTGHRLAAETIYSDPLAMRAIREALNKSL